MGAQTRTDVLPYISLIPVFGYLWPGTSTNILITTTPLDIGPVFRQQDVLACGFFFHLRAFLSCLQSLRPRFAQAGTAGILA